MTRLTSVTSPYLHLRGAHTQFHQTAESHKTGESFSVLRTVLQTRKSVGRLSLGLHILPEQFPSSSSLNPVEHWHWYEPSVLTHSAPLPHVTFKMKHSSISEKEDVKLCICSIYFLRKTIIEPIVCIFAPKNLDFVSKKKNKINKKRTTWLIFSHIDLTVSQ